MGADIEWLHGGLYLLTCGRVPELWAVQPQHARNQGRQMLGLAHSCLLGILIQRVDVYRVQNVGTQLSQLAAQLRELRIVLRDV